MKKTMFILGVTTAIGFEGYTTDVFFVEPSIAVAITEQLLEFGYKVRFDKSGYYTVE